ncbi:N-acetylmuramoyl-L-alanine amidase [Pseudoxanthomonas sangjuensis]|uniref:N-acetylmuramoyl-L-alanine amidase n=1 Tax=Pseudoxanthomonas sangjuensis TaxID=1503750 RepID=UPI0013917CA6|nr:N-acetylmuramoyl-L-alanine amidase [Pseudoxanthomonas sangjuensis]KAF1711942.1 N-acetylmuramoyl-L-alanine amidase [Pseudoxanthomonas sangjuensis]
MGTKRWLAVSCAAVLLAGCSSYIHTSRNPLATWVASPNRDVRKPVLVVLHFTEQQSVEQSLRTLRTANSGGRVSAHYLIGRDGERYQLVPDEMRAWHAGAGSWGTITDLNSASIGIEIDNDGQSDYPEAQIESLLVLLDDLCRRWSIPRTQVIGHSDLAPTRKVDPGPRFPWKRLHDAGFGVWPADDAPPAPPGFDPWRALAQIGYSLADRPKAVRAFHLHFRASAGETLDDEDLRILHALTRPAGGE